MIEYSRNNWYKRAFSRRLVIDLVNFKRTGTMFKPETTSLPRTSIDMEVTSFIGPIQYEGTINRLKAYYRDRNDEWEFSVWTGEPFHPTSKALFSRVGKSESEYGLSGCIKAEDRIMRLGSLFVRKYFSKPENR